MLREGSSINQGVNQSSSAKNKKILLRRLMQKCKEVLNAITKNQHIPECDVSSIEFIGTYFEGFLNKILEEEFARNIEGKERIISIIKKIKENQGSKSRQWVLRNLCIPLEQQNQSVISQKSLEHTLIKLFSQNLFQSTLKTGEQAEQLEQKIIQGHLLKIRNEQFSVLFTILTSNTMTAFVKHFRYDFETMITIDVRDLSSQTSSFFKDTLTLLKFLQSLRKIDAKLTDEGSLEIFIQQREFEILSKVDKLYKEFALIADDVLQLNQSDTFERIVQHHLHPEKPLMCHIQLLIMFHPPKKALQIVALQLFGKCEFQLAARIYRYLIDGMLQDNPFQEAFQGRGNQKDLLERLNKINQGNMQSILKDLSYFDCLFICEYLSIDLERAKAWYKRIWQQFLKNKQLTNRALIYGILNFFHQHHCYFLHNDDVLRLCKDLQYLCQDQHKISASQLLMGVYHALSKRQPNRRQHYYTMAVILAKTVIGLDPTNEAAWLVLCPSIMINTLNIVENPLFKSIRYGVIQAEIWMKHPNDINKAQSILSNIIKQNPYYREAYYASLKLERQKLSQILQKENHARQLDECIIRAVDIFGLCQQYFPNDIMSKYLIAQIYEKSDKPYQQDRARDFKRSFLKENEFLEQ